VCRFAAYLGPPIRLERFLLEPPHSLLKQSWQAREMRGATVNADGFGIGWYDAEQRPRAYRNPFPIWADPNLPALGASLERPLWAAGVRSATDSFSGGHANTQPFVDDELIFLHNGYLAGFADGVRPYIRRWLRPEFEAAIHGNTDSEYLFAALRQLYWENGDGTLEQALPRLCEQLADWAPEQPHLLNLAVADGRRLYALRHAYRGECPSLYFTADDDAFPNGQLLASEPLTETGLWQPVPPHHLLVLDPDEPPSLLPL